MGTFTFHRPKGSLAVPQSGPRKISGHVLFSVFFACAAFCSVVRAEKKTKYMPGPIPSGSLVADKKIPYSGYSEGLDFEGGFIWSAIPKSIRKIDPTNGSILAEMAPATGYSESVAWWKKDFWNVSYENDGIYKGRLEGNKFSFTRVGTTPEKHAWGIAHDGKQLILTGDHGSRTLYFLNPQTLKVERKITVEFPDLEDLAWDGKGIWTSSFSTQRGKIFRVDPKDGKIQGVYYTPEPEMCPVVDGIAVEGAYLWITGKNCPSIYRVKNPLK